MRTVAYTVKTPKGKIYPTWTFDNREEAGEFAAHLNERCHPHNYEVFACEIIIATDLLTSKKPE